LQFLVLGLVLPNSSRLLFPRAPVGSELPYNASRSSLQHPADCAGSPASKRLLSGPFISDFAGNVGLGVFKKRSYFCATSFFFPPFSSLSNPLYRRLFTSPRSGVGFPFLPLNRVLDRVRSTPTPFLFPEPHLIKCTHTSNFSPTARLFVNLYPHSVVPTGTFLPPPCSQSFQ